MEMKTVDAAASEENEIQEIKRHPLAIKTLDLKPFMDAVWKEAEQKCPGVPLKSFVEMTDDFVMVMGVALEDGVETELLQ
jgi:hypothetical protein